MSAPGRVLSLHVHPEKSGCRMIEVDQFDLVAEKGITQDKRYFGRRSITGLPGKRQVTLIERRLIDAHATALGLAPLPPGIVRSNIEIDGLELIPLIGRHVTIGTAVLHFIEPRTPCHKMDEIAPGLRKQMENSRQGVIARVLVSGAIRPGDSITPLE